MSTKIVDIEEIKQKLEYHKREVARWQTVLEALEELERPTHTSQRTNVSHNCKPSPESYSQKTKSATAQAIEISYNMLKSGKTVTSTRDFLEEIDRREIATKTGKKFNPSTLSAILGQSGLMHYDKEIGEWRLNN